MNEQSAIARGQSRSCACMGPQNGEPLCPCQMRNVREQNGRWVRVEDLGPVRPAFPVTTQARGCICPAGAEKTCSGITCPRRSLAADIRRNAGEI